VDSGETVIVFLHGFMAGATINWERQISAFTRNPCNFSVVLLSWITSSDAPSSNHHSGVTRTAQRHTQALLVHFAQTPTTALDNGSPTLTTSSGLTSASPPSVTPLQFRRSKRQLFRNHSTSLPRIHYQRSSKRSNHLPHRHTLPSPATRNAPPKPQPSHSISNCRLQRSARSRRMRPARRSQGADETCSGLPESSRSHSRSLTLARSQRRPVDLLCIAQL
jgi:hypothetical protein